MDKKAIFDFDKTLISVNSFTYWVLFLWIISLRKFNFRLFFKISYLIFLRKIIKKISHKDFKKELLLLNYEEKYDIIFCEKLHKYINHDVLNELIKLNNLNYSLAISSAAPEKYLKKYIENYLKIDTILIVGSVVENKLLLDNFKENKLSNLIKNNFLTNDEEYDFLFTDSNDDILLAKNAKKIYLISPNKETVQSYVNLYSSKIEIK